MEKWGAFAAGMVLGVGAFMLFHDLGAAPLAKYDEQTYVQVVRESQQRSDFLTFTLSGDYFFEKPPLYFWLMGASEALLGPSNFADRLPSALAGIAVLILVIALGSMFAGNFWVGAGASGLLLLTPPFLAGSRLVLMDGLVSAFILLALWAAWRRDDRVLGAAAGLAILSKSIVGGFAWLPLMALGRWRAALLGLAVALPWHAYESVRFGADFWRSYLGFHVLDRFMQNIFVDPALKTDYTARLLEQTPVTLGLFVLSLMVLALFWREASLRLRHGQAAVLGLAGLMLLVFFSAQTHALTYLIPVYPLAALSAAMSGSLAVQRVYARLRHGQTDRI